MVIFLGSLADRYIVYVSWYEFDHPFFLYNIPALLVVMVASARVTPVRDDGNRCPAWHLRVLRGHPQGLSCGLPWRTAALGEQGWCRD